MKRDITVGISLALFAMTWLIAHFIHVPQQATMDIPIWFRLLRWIMFACSLRAIILWFETIIHSIKRGKVIWVFGHIIFGPIAAYIYYFDTKESKKRVK
jgi:hypothetical protein